MPRKATPIEIRLMAMVSKHENGCWIFTGCKIKAGYGKISLTRSKPVFAHRVSYEKFVSEIPDGMNVLHRCDNPSCVNPDHLFLGTQKENWLDARSKGRNYPSPQETPNYRHHTQSKVEKI